MKVKDGKLVLSAKDTQIGNFVLTDQPEHWKITDIGERVSFRYHKTTLVGQVITLWADGKLPENYLNNLIITLYEVLTTVHDGKGMGELLKVCREEVATHPEIYGGKVGEPTDKEHEEAIEDVKAVQEVIENTADDNEKD